MMLRIGMSRQQYKRLESKGNPRLDTLDLVAKGLRVEVMLVPQDAYSEFSENMQIDKLSKNGDPDAISFPRPFNNKSHDFSFSGLKTALLNHIRKNPVKSKKNLFDVCAGYQEAIVETLIDKTFNAARKNGVESVVLAGGVACNSRLRKLSEERIRSEGINVFIPSPALCTDNAAMIATLGYHMYADNRVSALDISPYSTARRNPKNHVS